MSPWLIFIACFALTAFVGVSAAALRSLGYEVGGEEDQ